MRKLEEFALNPEAFMRDMGDVKTAEQAMKRLRLKLIGTGQAFAAEGAPEEE
jgi:hypothetical protein